MLKNYQFKTQCKGDIHSSKTTNIILPGLMTEYRTGERPYVYIQTRWHELFQPASIDAFELEYDFVHIRAFTYILSWVLAKWYGLYCASAYTVHAKRDNVLANPSVCPSVTLWRGI